MCLPGASLRHVAVAAIAISIALPVISSDRDVPSTETRALEAIQGELAASRDATEWESVARSWLARLDASGAAEGAAARFLVEALLERHPGDLALVWRRAEARAELGEIDAALADFEMLARDAAPPWSIRARRALPALYAQAGRFGDAVRADEHLLENRLADPIPVLERLARTSLAAGLHRQAKTSLERIGGLDPERLRIDAELGWLSAEVSAHLDDSRSAAAAWLRFASLHPEDPRAARALVAAGEKLLAAGDREAARLVAAEAVTRAQDPSSRVLALLLDAGVSARLDARDRARTHLESAVREAPSAELCDLALGRLIAADVEEGGIVGALAHLAVLARGASGFAVELAGSHFDRLLRVGWERLASTDADALLLVALAERAGREEVPAGLALRAARIREALGDLEAASRLYAIAGAGLGPAAREARLGLVRCDPRAEARGIAPHHADRLLGLLRERRFEEIATAVGDAEAQELDESARAIGARAAFQRDAPDDAALLLDAVLPTQAESALLRGDARAIAGDWDAACSDWRLAERLPFTTEAGRAWTQVRLAECSLHEGRRRLAARLAASAAAIDAGSPAALAARDLISQASTRRQP